MKKTWIHIKKGPLALIFISTLAMVVVAMERPIFTLIGGLADEFEIPALDINMGGGEAHSFQTHGTNGLNMSFVVGQPIDDFYYAEDNFDLLTSTPIISQGYLVTEFYSDRVPVSNLELTIDGKEPGILFTNKPDIKLKISFEDDLSGLKSARVSEAIPGGLVQNLKIFNPESFTFRLRQSVGDTDPEDGPYTLRFLIEDNAGNISSPEIEAHFVLDRSSPTTGTITINKKNNNEEERFTSNPEVNVTIENVFDLGTATTGVAAVRFSTDVEEPRVWSDPIPLYRLPTTLPWDLETASPDSEKYIFAQFQDGAGNWSVVPASDSITLGNFDPEGDLQIELVPNKVIQQADYVESSLTQVNLILSWSTSTVADVETIKVTRRLEAGGIEENEVIFVTTNSVVENNRVKLSSVSYQVAPETADDSFWIIKAVFFDPANNPSDPHEKRIFVNKNRPDAPPLDHVDIGSSSISIFISTAGVQGEILFLNINPSDVSQANGATPARIDWSTDEPFIIYTDTGLKPNTIYEYTVTAHELFVVSDDLKIIVNTHAEAPQFISHPTPLAIDVLREEWSPGENPLDTVYDIEWNLNNFSDLQAPCLVCQSSASVTALNLQIGGLAVGTTYYFRGRAYNKEGIPTAYARLGFGPTLSYRFPNPPISFSTKSVTSSAIEWVWVRDPSTETGFTIQSSTSGLVNIDIAALVSTYSYTETGLTPNTSYFRNIVSYNPLGVSNPFPPSSRGFIIVVTQSAPAEMDSVIAVGSEITVKWLANGNPLDTEYLVEIALNKEFTQFREDNGWSTDKQHTFRGLKPSSDYFIRVKSRDRNRQFEAIADFGVTRTKTFDHGKEADFSNILFGWNLRIPPNAFSEDYVVFMEGDPRQFRSTTMDVIQRATEKSRNESGGYRFPIPGGIIEIFVTSAVGIALEDPIRQSGFLSYAYPDSSPRDTIVDKSRAVFSAQNGPVEIPGMISPLDDNLDIRADTLRIWVLDPVSESWFKLPLNDVDLKSGQVNSNISRFGVFAVMGSPATEVSNVVVFPVPFRPNGPRAGTLAGQTGTDASGVNFANLPQEGQIKIFDLLGSMVWERSLSGKFSENWDTKNSNGEKAGSGTYYWVTESAGNRKTGKLMIIR